MNKRFDFWVWVLFTVERLTFYALFPLDWGFAYVRMQNLDVWSLKTDFWSSLWNLHMQPPLFNGFIGVVAKSFPEEYCPAIVQSVFFALACIAFACYRKMLRELVRSNRIVAVGNVAYLALPTVLFAERWFTYTFPVAALLLALAFLLMRYWKTAHFRYFVGYSALACIVVLTRSFFHVVVWMVPALGCAFLAGRKQKSFARIAIVMGVLMVAAVPYCMNWTRYGQFTASTFQGMNFFRTMHYVPQATIEREIATGRIHPVCRLRSFAPIEDYIALLPESGDRHALARHRVLDDVEKSSSQNNLRGEVNWNHRIVPIAGAELQKGFRRLVLGYPSLYFTSVLNGVYSFFTADVYHFWDNANEWLPRRGERAGLFLAKSVKAFVIPALFAAMFMTALVVFSADFIFRRSPVALFCLGTVLYVFGVSVTCELGETCIMRTPIDAFLLLGFVVWLDRMFGHRINHTNP